MFQKSALKISLIVLLFFAVSCGPARKPPPATSNSGVMTFDSAGGQPAPQPANPVVPPASPAPAERTPVNGLVTITVSADRNLYYAVTDIGYDKHYAGSDGRITFQITPGDHELNACDPQYRFAVSGNRANYALTVNGVRLTRVKSDPNGGMYYFFVYSDGSISANPP